MRLLKRAAGAVCLCLALAGAAGAQNLQLGIKAGWDHPTFGGKDVSGAGFTARNDFAGGVFLTVPLTPVFAFQPELLYVPKGPQISVTENGITATGKVKIDYAEIPLLLRLNVPMENAAVRPMVFAGPYVAFKASCKLSVSALGQNTSVNCGDNAVQAPVKSTDFGAAFGGGLELPLGGASALIEARYDLGLQTIDSSDPPDDIKNRGLLVFVGFSFPIGSGRAATSRTK